MTRNNGRTRKYHLKNPQISPEVGSILGEIEIASAMFENNRRSTHLKFKISLLIKLILLHCFSNRHRFAHIIEGSEAFHDAFAHLHHFWGEPPRIPTLRNYVAHWSNRYDLYLIAFQFYRRE